MFGCVIGMVLVRQHSARFELDVDIPDIIHDSGPFLKGHSLERTLLYKGHKFLTASTMNVCTVVPL